MKGTKTLLSYLIFLIGLQWKTVYVVSAEECGVNYFKCKKNGRCVLGAFRCDGEFDCEDDDGDKSDEENCEKKPIEGCSLATDFQCKNGKCIPKSYTCDYMDDCGDNSDESSTDGPLCSPTEGCPSGMFKCKKSGKCIYQSYQCDGEIDCGEGDDSDEKECDVEKCNEDEFKCNDYRCIEKDWVCDGRDDCGDNSDEKNCPTVAPSTSSPVPKTTTVTSTRDRVGLLREGINCENFSFYCPNDKRCISDNWVCDGFHDCSDGYDERPEYCNNKCKENEFTCPDGSCILESQKCDGVNQCPNGEDELLPQCDVSVPCTNKTYKCEKSDKCLNQENVCDHIKHCPKGDDEDSKKCGVNECSTKNGGCSHHCVDLKLGHRCECPYGYKMKADNKTCIDINECLIPGICSQFCVNEAGSYRCECDEGYEMLSDKKTCKVKAPKPYLVFSNGKDIREVSTNFHDYKLVIKQTANVASIDADISNGMIYWVNRNEKSIHRAPKDGSKPEQVIVKDVSPISLSLDWIGQKLYWINIESNKISVSNLDGSHMKTFLQGENGDKFDYLDIVPEKSLMYFSNRGDEPKIEKINLDGTNRKTVIGKSHCASASYISVDRVLEKLFWVNTSNTHILSSKLDGTKIETIVKLPQTVVSGLTVFEDYLYFTSEKSNEIYKINKYTGKREGKVNKINSPSDIMVYHPAAQKKVNHPCQTLNGGCSHLCFVVDVESKTLQCDCPDAMKLLTDNKTCIPKDLPTTTGNCRKNEYMCRGTTQCLPQRLICNGKRNCPLNDDELNCVETSKPKAPAAPRTGTKSSKKTLFIIIGASVGFLFILVICVVIYCQYKKKSQKLEMSMVFKKDGEALHGKNFDDKIDVEVKYVPNTLNHKNKKGDRNFANKNFNDGTPLTNEHMDTECMVDDDGSDNSSSDICFDESQPIIS